MNKTNQILLMVLLLQVAIAGSLFFTGEDSVQANIKLALLDAQNKTIDDITIQEAGDKVVRLRLDNGHWQMPDYHQLPVDKEKVDQLLSKLKSTYTNWPVTTTASSHERFKLSEDNFAKKIVLKTGDKVAQSLLLGTSPGYRQIHVRRTDEDNVYALKLNSYDFPTNNDNWLDKKLLQVEGDISKLTGPDFSLTRQGADWHLQGVKDEVDEDQVDKLTHSLKSLSIQSVAQKSFEQSDFELKLTMADKEFQYRLKKDDSNYYVSRQDRSQWFKISQSQYESITQYNAQKLAKSSKENEPQDVVHGEPGKKIELESNS